MNTYVVITSFLGTAVEFIEALTIVLAVGVVKGWKSSLAGMSVALFVLAALVTLFGVPLMALINLKAFQLIIGILMLLFGMRWLRKAILRYAGLKALHLEEKAYKEELNRQLRHANTNKKIDWFGFVTSFNIVLLEGVEAIFIVLTFGLAAHSLISAIIGSIIGLILVVLAGVLLRKPLAAIPENTMKFIVGLMLSGFGIFWVGEGIGVHWWHADISILIITLLLMLVSFTCVRLLYHSNSQEQSKDSSKKVSGDQL
jgi:Ca2+/H+ antiporter, TMEM165/GDT1 family